MRDAEPDRGPAPQPLAARLGDAARGGIAALRAWKPGPAGPWHNWYIAAALAALIALGPVITILGANILSGRARAEAQIFERKAAPRVAAAAAIERDRATLTTALRRPGIGATIEAIARVLPPEAALVRAERGADGLLELEIRAPDPDKLRAALRRESALATLRDTGQRQAEAAMLVTLKEQAP
jgi:hypothetical protein